MKTIFWRQTANAHEMKAHTYEHIRHTPAKKTSPAQNHHILRHIAMGRVVLNYVLNIQNVMKLLGTINLCNSRRKSAP